MEVNKIKPVKVDFAIMDPAEVEKVLKKRSDEEGRREKSTERSIK